MRFILDQTNKVKSAFFDLLAASLTLRSILPLVRVALARRNLDLVPRNSPRTRDHHQSYELFRQTIGSKHSGVCVAFLIVGSELDDFLINSLRSLREVEPNAHVFVFVDQESEERIKRLVRFWNVNTLLLPLEGKNSLDSYQEFGSRGFNHVSNLKWMVFRELFNRGFELVVYSDVDVVFLRPFLSYVERVAQEFPVGLQSEGQDTFPPLLCAGFMFFSARAKVIASDLELISRQIDSALNDQEIINARFREDGELRRLVYELPSHLFANGLFAESVRSGLSSGQQVGPGWMVFHANFVSGTQAKKEMLRRVGLWNPEPTRGEVDIQIQTPTGSH